LVTTTAKEREFASMKAFGRILGAKKCERNPANSGRQPGTSATIRPQAPSFTATKCTSTPSHCRTPGVRSGGRGLNYARRQQYRWLRRTVAAAWGAGVFALLAVLVASAGTLSTALVLAVFAGTLGFQARPWLHLAGRSRVDARSEDEVRCALGRLVADGWRVRHSLRWSGRGDIDSVAIRPGVVAFAIEVKTSRYEYRHLAMVQERGGMVVALLTKIVPARRCPGSVCGSRPRRAPLGGRRVRRLDRLPRPSRPMHRIPSALGADDRDGGGSPPLVAQAIRHQLSGRVRPALCFPLFAGVRR
jgi:hypothetical protein